ncbi:MAG: YdcF family protein [Planctomycetes bacterium]|nr:YdcF family protein [Planctomycetota bacterium]
MKQKSKIWRFCKRFTLLCVVLNLALFAGVYFGGAVESESHADAIVVPGAAIWKNRKPSDALLYRLHTALDLFQDGRADIIIVTGGGVGNYAEAEVMAEWLLQQGVPESAIIIENNSGTTRDSGVNVGRVMKSRKLESALVVSNWFHVARTRLTLEQEGIDTYAAPAGGNVLVREPYFVMREMAGLPVYALRLDELRG